MGVEDHYQQHLDPAQLLAAISERLGDTVTTSQLAPIDQLHLGGRKATRQLLDQTCLYTDMRVLDLGCGLGGTSRLIAELADCDVVGIDLTPEFCQLATALNQRLPQPLPVRFIQGDAQKLPFAQNQFDLVVSQHCLMNLPNPLCALRELRRVLKPGGQLLMHEVLAGNGEAHYPVPWASDASQSFLVGESAFQQQLIEAGFRVQHWQDESHQATQWRARHSEREKQGVPSLSPALIYGSRFKQLAQNLLLNLQQGRIRIVQASAY